LLLHATLTPSSKTRSRKRSLFFNMFKKNMWSFCRAWWKSRLRGTCQSP